MTHELFNVVLTIDTPFMQQFGNAFVLGRMQIAEAIIFQLPFQLTDT